MIFVVFMLLFCGGVLTCERVAGLVSGHALYLTACQLSHNSRKIFFIVHE